MSMNAMFVQIEAAQLARIKARPALAEALFESGPMLPPVFAALGEAMQEKIKTSGPPLLAQALSRLDPDLRRQLEERIGRTTAALSGGAGGDVLLKMMKERAGRGAAPASPSSTRATLSLDKNWHGVHYVLCGGAEPGPELLSRAVLGGTVLGEDDEGFSGYGPARCFDAAEVAELAAALARPETQAQAAARFDAEKMSQLEIYPGWRPSDAESVMEALQRLRDFYAEAARAGRAIVTCLV